MMALALALAIFWQEACGQCGNAPRSGAKYCDQCGRALEEMKGGRIEQALLFITNVLDEDPRNFDALLLRAEWSLRTGGYAIAAQDARLAIKLRSGEIRPHLIRAAALRLSVPESSAPLTDVERARLLDAMGNAASAAELDKNSAPAFRELALIRARLGQLRDALADADRAVALDPKSVDSYMVRAGVLGRLKDLEGALADYDRTLRIQPGHPATLEARGLLNCEEGMTRLENVDPKIQDRQKLGKEDKAKLIEELQAASQLLQEGMTDIEESNLKTQVSRYVIALRMISAYLKELLH